MATIKDIAQAAGVSRGTVDRVLHNRGHVDSAVAERIFNIAKELSYRPNRAGQALANMGRKRRIGIVMPSLSNPFFLDIKNGMEKSGEENEMALTFFHYSGYGEKECLGALKEAIENSDSLLLTLPDYRSVVEEAEASSLPFASINTGLSSSSSLFYSGPDYRQKGRINAGLLSLMCSSFTPRVLFLRGNSQMKGHMEILEGFKSAMDERGTRYSLAMDIDTEDDDAICFKATRSALEKDKEINTVFISTAGFKGAMDAIGDRKLFVFSSDDTALISAALEEGRIVWTVSQDPYLQGYYGVKKMAEYLVTGEKPTDFLSRNVVKIRENIGEKVCL